MKAVGRGDMAAGYIVMKLAYWSAGFGFCSEQIIRVWAFGFCSFGFGQQWIARENLISSILRK